MSKLSMTGVGLVVYVVSIILTWFGIAVDTTEITGFVNSLVNIIGFALMIAGQLRRKDLIGGIYRK